MARKGQGTEILQGWQAGAVGGEDFLRSVVERVVQQVLDAEMTSFLGADSYERGPDRRGWRNGYKPRTLKTRVGELELMVPKDRDLSGREFRNHNGPISLSGGDKTIATLLDEAAVTSRVNYWAVIESHRSASCRVTIIVW
jgi:hypothetical protein